MIVTKLTSQRGGDSGRHQWYRWRDGPEPEGTKTTIALNIFDLMLLDMENAVGSRDYSWKEPKPNSEFATRILGNIALKSKDCKGLIITAVTRILNLPHHGNLSHMDWLQHLSPGLLACEEHLELIRPFVTTLQAESKALQETGYQVLYNGEEYDFLPVFKHRWDL